MKTKKFILLLFKLFFVAIITFSLFMIIRWNKEKGAANKEIRDIKKTIKKDKGINFDKLRLINKDVVGWIKVPNTSIDYPVVRSTNNHYYLNHSFKKEDSSAGWIFMDYRNKLDGNDKNLIIYGHNRLDGIMFGELKKLLDKDWFKNKDNLNIEFITPKEKFIYKVFSIYKIKDETYYLTTDLDTNYDKFIDKLKSRSKYDFETELNGNSILTLSTCSDDVNSSRLVVHAIKTEKK